jgi:hypothetical protein
MKLIVATLLIAASLFASDNEEDKVKIKAFQEFISRGYSRYFQSPISRKSAKPIRNKILDCKRKR